MKDRLRNRLNRLENGSEYKFSEILCLIKSGAFYDELTDEQKQAYSEYIGVDREGLEGCEIAMSDFLGRNEAEALHFKLEFKKPPPTREELNQLIQEVEEYLKTGDDI